MGMKYAASGYVDILMARHEDTGMSESKRCFYRTKGMTEYSLDETLDVSTLSQTIGGIAPSLVGDYVSQFHQEPNENSSTSSSSSESQYQTNPLTTNLNGLSLISLEESAPFVNEYLNFE